jgi:tetratricopeptide (TPR) repeat protein
LLLRAAYGAHELRRYEESIAICRELLERYPEEREACARALLRLAYAYEYQGNLEQARTTFQRLIEDYQEFTPSIRVAKADLAFTVLARQGEFRRAIQLTREVLSELDPQSPLAVTLQFRLAWFYAPMGEDEEALRELKKVPSGQRGSDPHMDVRIWAPYLKAACLLRLGRLSSAKQVLEEALRRHPTVKSIRSIYRLGQVISPHCSFPRTKKYTFLNNGRGMVRVKRDSVPMSLAFW